MRVRTTADREAGLALVSVVLMTIILAAIGVFAVMLVNRNTEKQASYTKSVAGFYAAEAGINRGAGDARNIFLGYNVPAGSDCNPHTMAVNDRQVTYQLQGCVQTPLVVQVPTGEPFEGLNAIRYVYDLRSEAQNSAGFTEAVLRLRFETRLIPMFQLAAFYKDDLELTVGPPMVINGRMHTNKNMFLNTGSCPSLQILGQVTVVDELFRGRKDTQTSPNGFGVAPNGGQIWIANPDASLRVLGRAAPGDTSCSPALAPRSIPSGEAALWSGRVRTGLKGVSIPGQNELLCAPWSCPAGSSPGTFWQRADLRIVLNTTRTEKLDPDNPAAAGPALYALEVYNPDGTISSAATSNLRRFVRDVPGAITYNDVPLDWECPPASGCEDKYKGPNNYAVPFPKDDGTNGCTQKREPRERISADKYCNDFRYGGFYNWRERKPILMLNVDWRKLEEWNQTQSAGQRLFDPNDSTDGGLVVYTSIRGPNSAGPNNYAMRIYNAQRLRHGSPDRGVTFASDQAAYVMGNFNCAQPGVTSDSVPATCGTNGKKPAAVLGDTINVLSCAWVENACVSSISNGVSEPASQVYRPLDERSTTSRPGSIPSGGQTFVNAAFLAGNDDTTCPGNPGGRDCGYNFYSGGLENYPRFHEVWGSSRLWYQGSFVAIDTPKHTCFTFNAGLTASNDPSFSCRTHQLTGNWLQGYWYMQATYGYSPPPRRWFYDVAFNDASNLPPLSPRFLVLRQTYFTEEFR
jgi:hypothetical protein